MSVLSEPEDDQSEVNGYDVCSPSHMRLSPGKRGHGLCQSCSDAPWGGPSAAPWFLPSLLCRFFYKIQ